MNKIIERITEKINPKTKKEFEAYFHDVYMRAGDFVEILDEEDPNYSDPGITKLTKDLEKIQVLALDVEKKVKKLK